jgi:hypothetical protein
MKIKTLVSILLLTSVCSINISQAQVKIGDNANTINENSIFELESTNKGILFPRVSLENINSSAPLTGTVGDATLVYNTNELLINGQGKGFYYWNAPISSWTSLISHITSENSYWGMNGNIGTNPDNNFIGTSDEHDFVIRTNNNEVLRADVAGNIGIGITPSEKLHVAGNINIDNRKQYLSIGGQRFLSTEANTGEGNTMLGFSAGEANFWSGPGARNVYFGNGAGANNSDGESSIFVGYNSGIKSNGGYGNIFIGEESGFQNNGTKGNIFIGNNAGHENASGEFNTFIGLSAGNKNIKGSGITLLGANAQVENEGLYNATAIGYNAIASINNSIILGNEANVGVGTSSPLAKLEVVGDILINGANGLRIAEAEENATMGITQLKDGERVISTSKITDNSRIYITIQNPNSENVGTVYIASRKAGDSFTVKSTNSKDDSEIAWLIIEPK